MAATASSSGSPTSFNDLPPQEPVSVCVNLSHVTAQGDIYAPTIGSITQHHHHYSPSALHGVSHASSSSNPAAPYENKDFAENTSTIFHSLNKLIAVPTEPVFEDINEELISAFNNNFCGRIELVGKENINGRIASCFEKKDKINLFLLYGPSGYGKTQASIQYAVNHLISNSGKYHCIAKINAESLPIFISSYQVFFRKISSLICRTSKHPDFNEKNYKEITSIIKKLLKEYVALTNEKLLLIIDGTQDYEIINFLPTYIKNIDIIITSTTKYIGPTIPGENIFKLEELSDEETSKLISSIFGREKYNVINKDLLREFIISTHKIPLLVTIHAYAIIDRARGDNGGYAKSMEVFIEELKYYDPFPIIEYKGDVGNEKIITEIKKYYKNIIFCLDDIFRRDNFPENLNKSIYLLLFLSLLGRQVPKKMLSRSLSFLGNIDKMIDPFLKLEIIKNYKDYFEIPSLISQIFFNHVTFNINKWKDVFETMVDTIFTLEKEYFISLPMEGKYILLTRFIELDCLVKSSAFKINPNNINFLYDLTLEVMEHYYRIEHWIKFRELLIKIVSYHRAIKPRISNYDEKHAFMLSKVLNSCGLICIEMIEQYEDSANHENIFDIGESAFKEALDIRKDIFLEWRDEILRLKNNLATLYIVMKKNDKAFEILNNIIESVEIYNKTQHAVSDTHNYLMAKAYDTLGLLYLNTRNHDLALFSYNQSIEIYSKIKIQVPEFNYFLPFTYTQRGKTRYEKALLSSEPNEELILIKGDFIKSLALHGEYHNTHPNVMYEFSDGIIQNYSFLSKILSKLSDKEGLNSYCRRGIEYIKQCQLANGFQSTLDQTRRELDDLVDFSLTHSKEVKEIKNILSLNRDSLQPALTSIECSFAAAAVSTIEAELLDSGTTVASQVSTVAKKSPAGNLGL